MKRLVTRALVCTLAMSLAACGALAPPPPDISAVEPAAAGELAQRALEVARADEEVAAFLDDTDFLVEPVRTDGDRVHLLLRFDESVPLGGLWDRTCDATDGQVSGAHFVLDLESEMTVEMSPRWGPESCIPLPAGG